MIRFTNIDLFLEILSKCASTSTYHLYIDTSERFSGMSTSGTPKNNNTYLVKLVLLSSLGQFYFYDNFRLKDTDTIELIKSKISPLEGTYCEITVRENNQVSIG